MSWYPCTTREQAEQAGRAGGSAQLGFALATPPGWGIGPLDITAAAPRRTTR